jgi:transposase-like protein
MPIDPRGTTPGLTPAAKPDENLINLKCRNPKCTNITATEIKVPNRKGIRIYCCTKCGHTWTISVGGQIDI